jgi:glutathione S-transferase
LDWHHTNLRPGAAGYVLNSVLGPALGLPLNPKAAAEAEQLLTKSLTTLDTFWLKGNAMFLLGSNQPSIADLSLVCELTQLQVLKKTCSLSNIVEQKSYLLISVMAFDCKICVIL